MSSLIYKNKPDWYFIICVSLIPLFLCSFGLLRYYSSSILNFLILAIIVSLFIETGLFIREFVYRPSLICINDDQITLTFRFGPDKIIIMSNIKLMYINEMWKDIPILRQMGKGGAVNSSEFPNGVLLNFDILKKIVEFYYQQYGRYPEIKSESS